MRKFILPILFLHLAMAVNAATYYFSSVSGDDNRTSSQAQNSSTPWKTISKLNSIMSSLKPGDQVLFNRGESFDGGITVTVSGSSTAPIFFGAYGTGNKPVINGFSILWNWKQVNGNIWECPFWQPVGSEHMVIKNGLQQAIGRYPNRSAANGGYLTIDSHVGLTQLTSSQLPASPNWTGADIAIRKNRWVIDRSTVTYQSGTTVGFVSGSDNTITDKYGFFFENSPNTLDQDGEWWYDRSRTKLQMYFADNNPNAYQLRGSTVETLVTLSFINYITFDNLAFQGANQFAFNLTNSGYIKVNACDISYVGTDAIKALSSPNFTFSGSTINSSNNDGLNLYWYCSNATITNNTLKNIAAVPGMAQNSGNSHQGINVNGDNVLIQYNELDSIGHDGIHFEGDYTTVKNNFVNVFGMTVDDCGGIYTGPGDGITTVYNSRSILNNIILNGVGAVAGTDNTSYIATQGIYLDANTNHITVSGNTVANCGQRGIFNHNSTYVNIAGNTMYNNGSEQFLAVRTSNPVSNVTVKNNIMFAKTASQITGRVESYYGSNNISGLGTVDSNYYCRPIDNGYIFYDMYQSGSTYNTAYDDLNSWKSKFGFDAHSQSAPATIPAFTATNLSGVNKYSNGSFTSSVSDVGIFSSTGDMTKSWVSGKLDGGCLQVSSTSYPTTNNYMVTIPVSSGVTAGKSYQLTFSVQSAGNDAPLTVYLRQNTSPNIDLTTRTKIPLSTSRQEIKLGFTATTTATNVAIELDVASPNGAIWIDNMILQDATITPTNPDNYILFSYNPSKSSKKVSLSEAYYDAKGATYTGSVTIPAYSSVVLFKKSGSTQTAKVVTESAQAISLQGNLVDAQPASYTASSSTDLNWQVDNQSNTSYYTVERSPDNIHFLLIGRTDVKNNDASTVAYRHNDATPEAGKNWYRVTQYNEKGVAGISKVIMVNNFSFKINPNPARDVIHVTFDHTVSAADNIGKDAVIRNASGVTVKTVQLPSTDNLDRADIVVSELKPGMYMLTLTSEGKTFSKSFLKQ